MKIRFYVKDSKRKPDPQPVRTNALLAVRVGIVLWILALIGLLAVPGLLPETKPWWPYTCVVGVALGLFALFRVRGR